MFKMVSGTPHAKEGSGKLGTPESSGMATSVLTLDRPMGENKAKTAAKFGDVIAQVKDEQVDALLVMGKEMKECTKLLERKTLLEHNFKMLEFYQGLNQGEKVQEILAKIEKLEQLKYCSDDGKVSGKRKAPEDEENEESMGGFSHSDSTSEITTDDGGTAADKDDRN